MKHNYQFSLPNHAVTNLRQYAPARDLPMDDETLRMKLDDKLREAIAAGRVYASTNREDGSPNRNVMLEKEDFGAELTAILVPDAYNPGREAVVTIFPSTMQAPRARQAPTPPPAVERSDPNARLVSYRTKHAGARNTYEQVDRAAVKDKIAGLVQGGVDTDTIRVWRPVELKVARRIEVDVAFGEDGVE